MPRRFCHSCKASLHAADGHSECVSCLGKSHAEATLKETECPHCKDMSLASLRSRIASFSECDSAPRARMASRTFAYQGGPGLCRSPDPLDELAMDGERHAPGYGLQEEGWGALCDGKSAFGLWTKAKAGIHINCLEMLAVCRALHFFLPDLKGHHVLVRSDSMTVVSYINCQGGLSSKRLFTLVKDLLEWAQLNLCSLRATHVPGRLNQGADMLSRSNVPSGEWMLHPQVVQKIWEVFGKAEVDLFASEDNSHCPITQVSQGTETQTPSGGPSLEKPALVLRAVPAARSSPLAHSPETRPSLSGERDNMAPPAQAVGPAPLVSGRESMNLSESVLNTISQARAPSTRRLYALKWSVFSAWCSTRGEDPVSCDISVILSFLQELLDKGCSPSTLKVYVAAITASHAPIAGQSVGRNNLVVRFLKGSRRLNPPCPLTIPTWDLSTVLRALKGPPFEPLPGSDL
ncbi:hypothetical protein H4Q32_024702 [Labeo rohita]|uniref:Core-binding (CB) domain-containing protein n=1 Tax=Labeo rohita TaxID=84645 RepID=A0ABQ8L255_LABRO|nr:hypothetical protein H4Q32_024702 [Labeo rohita]